MRKGSRSPTAGEPAACFNGAATFRLRKVPLSDSGIEICQKLQWGRNLSVAEGAISLPDALNYVMLQWGRNLSVAEGSGDRALACTPARFNGAATFRLRKGHQAMAGSWRAICFNGAATFRLRKGHAGGTSRGASKSLQWGRNLSVAEGQCLAMTAPKRPKLQ